MISPERFYHHLAAQGVDFFTGVPDSLMKPLLQYFHEHIDASKHIIAANEGLAVALAAGYHFSTGKLPLVYMQNSGLGNAVNPLTSLADKEMYAVPMLLLIGWRGQPGHKDEPQHKKMGRITQQMLDTLEIPAFILPDDETHHFDIVAKAVATATSTSQPVALLVSRGLFEDHTVDKPSSSFALSREYVLNKLFDYFTGDETVVCTTGETGREFYALNRQRDIVIQKELLSVGAMGLAGHIALGIDLQQNGRVVMLDGDGALLMHMGALPVMGQLASASLVHIVFNNGCHASVGGQPTVGLAVDFCAMAKACGYENTYCIQDEAALINWLQQSYRQNKKQFVEIKINASTSAHLGRPGGTPLAWKEAFMNAFQNKKH
jgi:phosphonopyruvate decarboxylase